MKGFLYCGCVILSVILYVKSDTDVTLTTATMRESTSPKPSTIYRRINIDINAEDRANVPLNIFLLQNLESRRSLSDVWNWDYWCQLQPKRGNCSRDMQRYYYNAQLDQCILFEYSGCGGNKNNFDLLIDCERYCKGASYMGLKEVKSPMFCTLQPDSGLCMAFINKYYYDVNENRCKNFKYGGCGGNQNRFDTMLECRRHCSVSHMY